MSRANVFELSKGRRIGVDGHVWLHNLAYQHAESIVVLHDYRSLARDFLQRAVTAQGYGCQLLFVFDGAPTPAKSETDQARQVRRQKAMQQVMYEEVPDAKTLRAAVSLGWEAVKAVLIELTISGLGL